MNIPTTVLRMNNPKAILITPTGYTYNPGVQSIKSSMTQKEYKDFMIYMADMLATTFHDAIDIQRYKGSKWPPLSISYITWKGRHNLSLNIWEATGCLKNNIKVFKKGDFIAVGFKQSDVYPKSLAKVNTIARYMEYGTNKRVGAMPPRPLFRPITVYMRKHVSDYYKRYQKELKDKNKNFLYL